MNELTLSPCALLTLVIKKKKKIFKKIKCFGLNSAHELLISNFSSQYPTTFAELL